jgi:hypothetical protein
VHAHAEEYIDYRRSLRDLVAKQHSWSDTAAGASERMLLVDKEWTRLRIAYQESCKQFLQAQLAKDPEMLQVADSFTRQELESDKVEAVQKAVKVEIHKRRDQQQQDHPQFVHNGEPRTAMDEEV